MELRDVIQNGESAEAVCFLSSEFQWMNTVACNNARRQSSHIPPLLFFVVFIFMAPYSYILSVSSIY